MNSFYIGILNKNFSRLIYINGIFGMKSRSPTKNNPCYLNEDKLKIIIRMRPILNEEDSDEFVELEDVMIIIVRIILCK